MKNKNQTGLKNFKPKINLNQNIYNEKITTGTCMPRLILIVKGFNSKYLAGIPAP